MNTKCRMCGEDHGSLLCFRCWKWVNRKGHGTEYDVPEELHEEE